MHELTSSHFIRTGVGEDDGIAVADELVDSDLAVGGLQRQVGDGVSDRQPRHGFFPT